MKIEFPEKYRVKRWSKRNYHVEVPPVQLPSLLILLNAQDWVIQATLQEIGYVSLWVSEGYEYTDEEMYLTLCKLAEHVMGLRSEIDPEVWNLEEE